MHLLSNPINIECDYTYHTYDYTFSIILLHNMLRLIMYNVYNMYNHFAIIFIQVGTNKQS